MWRSFCLNAFSSNRVFCSVSESLEVMAAIIDCHLNSSISSPVRQIGDDSILGFVLIKEVCLSYFSKPQEPE